MWKFLFTKIIKMREKVGIDLGQEDAEKPFIEHLEDLRTMIVRMAVTLTLFACGAFVFYERLMKAIFYPIHLAGIWDKTALQELNPVGLFMAAMNVSIAIGIILACPLLLYFLLQFILPGLRTTEKKVIFPALGVGVGLFMCGACFAFFVVAPKALGFFYQFNNSVVASPVPAPPPQKIKIEIEGGTLSVKPATGGGAAQVIELAGGTLNGKQSIIIEVDSLNVSRPYLMGVSYYVRLITQLVLVFGLCFELPVVVMALVKLDILSHKVMSSTRGYAVIAIAVVSAVIAPAPDVFTLGLIAGPMIVLYEICIWLAWWLERRDRAANPQYYKDLEEDEKAMSAPDEWDNENYNPWSEDSRDDDDLKPKSLTDTPAPKSPEGTVPHEPTPPDAPDEKLKDEHGDTPPREHHD